MWRVLRLHASTFAGREDKGVGGGPKYKKFLPHHLILIFTYRNEGGREGGERAVGESVDICLRIFIGAAVELCQCPLRRRIADHGHGHGE